LECMRQRSANLRIDLRLIEPDNSRNGRIHVAELPEMTALVSDHHLALRPRGIESRNHLVPVMLPSRRAPGASSTAGECGSVASNGRHLDRLRAPDIDD